MAEIYEVMKRIAGILSMLVCAIATYGQTPYCHRHAIDLAGGMTMSYKNISEHNGRKAYAGGVDFSLRYTIFIGKHWGAFIEGNAASNSVSKNRFYRQLRQIDNGELTYSVFKTGKKTPNSSYQAGIIGTVYRYEKGRWSVIPFLGAGVAKYFRHLYRYYTTEVGALDDTPVAVNIYPTPNENESSVSRIIPVIKGGVQVRYYTGRHFHIGVSLDCTALLSRDYSYIRLRNTETPSANIGNVFIDVLLLGILWREPYTQTETIRSETVSSFATPISSIKFFFGWNF